MELGSVDMTPTEVYSRLDGGWRSPEMLHSNIIGDFRLLFNREYTAVRVSTGTDDICIIGHSRIADDAAIFSSHTAPGICREVIVVVYVVVTVQTAPPCC